MRGPEKAEVLEYVRQHPGTDVHRIVADMYPDATPYETRYMRGWVSGHLTELRAKGLIIGEHAPGSRHMKLWRAVA